MRIQYIFSALKKGHYPNCNTLANELEVTPKTIQRDLDHMRDVMEYPIEYDQSKRGYYFSAAVDHLPNITVSESEIFAMLVAQNSLRAFHGTPYERPLTRAFEKLSSVLDDTVSIPWSEMNDIVGFKPLGYANVDDELFHIISRALGQQREITFKYKGYKDTQWKKRRLQPWHLSCVDNQWYVLGYDLHRKATRNFVLVRMKDVTVEKETFKRPADFDAKAAFKNAFGVFAGEDKIEVVIDFDGPAARLVKEKTWHPSQTIKDLSEDTVRLTMVVPNFIEVERWILSWGESAIVRKPASLRNSIKRQLGNLTKKYG